MFLKPSSRLIAQSVIGNARGFCYKPIKRPDFNSTSSKKFVEQKMKSFELNKVLRAKIDMTGPITVASYMNDILTNPQSGKFSKV